jgi:hypothetical protein
MARVNFDDKEELDPRFANLAEMLGCADRARGMLIRFWRDAQNYWVYKDAGIPWEVFASNELLPLLKSHWAYTDYNEVYAVDGESKFAWLRDSVEKLKLREKKNLTVGNFPRKRPPKKTSRGGAVFHEN